MDTLIEDIRRLAGITEQQPRAGIVEPDQSGHQAKLQEVSALLSTMLRAIESGNVETIRHMQGEVMSATNTLSEVLRDLQYQEMQTQV